MCSDNAAGDRGQLPRKYPWLACLAGGIVASLLWLPVVGTPFLQDDYGFLYEMAAADAAGEPYRVLWLATGERTFWRPVSVGLHWRVVTDLLASSALAAHILGIVLVAFASACVGRLSVMCMEQWDSARSGTAPGFWAALLYGCHGAQFFPAAWVSAVQETYAVLWSALALIAFLWYCRRTKERFAVAVLSALFLCLAHLSKEGTVVLPFVAGVLWLFFTDRRRSDLLLLVFWGMITVSWLWGRSLLVSMPADATPYAPTFGYNILRNGILAVLFMFNLPRESVLLWVKDGNLWAAAWGAACVVLQASAFSILLLSIQGRLRAPQIAGLLLFSAVCLLPYLPLYSQAYPYYMLLALIPWGMLVERVARDAPRRVLPAAVCAVASSALLLAGEKLLPYPAPVARAEWANEALRQLHSDHESQREARAQQALYVYVGDDNRLAAVGYGGGLALASGLKKEQVILQDQPTSQTQVWLNTKGIITGQE